MESLNPKPKFQQQLLDLEWKSEQLYSLISIKTVDTVLLKRQLNKENHVTEKQEVYKTTGNFDSRYSKQG